MVWQGLAYVTGKLVVAATTIALARIVAPAQFGLVALAMVFITFADVVSDGGVAQALIYLERSPRTTRSALLVATCTGGLLTAAGVLGAPAAATFFHRPDVVPLVRVLSVVLFIGSVSAVPESLLRRGLQYRRLALASVTRAVATGATGIGLALAGFQAWALVWGTVTGGAVYLVATWLLLPGGVDARVWLVRRSELGVILRYGLPAAAGILLSRLIFDLDYLVIGRRLGAEPLGFYTVAFRLPELAIINVFFVLSSVTFPLYSKARGDPARLRSGYLTSIRLQSLYGVAAGVGLAVVAPDAVSVLLGGQWAPAAPCLAALGLYAAMRSIGAGANDLYKAIGRPSISVWVSLVRLAVLLPGLLWASRWGIEGVAWAQAGLAGAFALLMQGVAIRVIGLPVRRFVSALAPAALAGLLVAATAAVIELWLPAPAAVRLPTAVLLSGLVTLAGLRLLAPGVLHDVGSSLRRRRT